MLGITAGCLLGMIPLMFMKKEKEGGKESSEDVKKETLPSLPTPSTPPVK